MSYLTFKEHLFLYEERRQDLKYTEKQVKGVLDRVSIELAGSEAANMTKLAKRYARLEASIKAMKEKHEELNTRLKGDVAGLFEAEEAVLTRVVETAQFTLTMAKEIKKADTSEVDYTSIIAALSVLIPDELQAKIEQITTKYTKVVPAKDPIKRLSVSKEVVKEGLMDWVKGFVASIMSWASRYDAKLDRLKEKAGIT